MNYDLKNLAVVNLFIVPKHFFVQEIIQERRPLAATARRASWIGSNILIGQVPEAGKIHIVQSGVVRPKEVVLREWQKTLFLREESLEARGWLLDLSNSCLVVTIAYDLRRLAWLGFSTSMTVIGVVVSGPINGPALAKMIALTVAQGICLRQRVKT
jgi:hypothetical protein